MKGRSHGHRYVRLDDPIFRARHWVFFGPQRTLQKAVHAVTGYSTDAPPDAAGTCGVIDAPGCAAETLTVVFKGAMPSEYVDTLCHELNHAALYALTAANLKLTRKTTEVLAHYHEWLFREGRRGVGL